MSIKIVVSWINLKKDTLAKVLDWNLFRVNQNHSDSFRYLYPSQCESFRTNPKNVLYLIWWKTVKNQSDLIRLITRFQFEWIRTNPKPSFQSRSFGLILIENSVLINPRPDWSGFDLDWKLGLGLVWIHSDWYLGINRIKSN